MLTPGAALIFFQYAEVYGPPVEIICHVKQLLAVVTVKCVGGVVIMTSQYNSAQSSASGLPNATCAVPDWALQQVAWPGRLLIHSSYHREQAYIHLRRFRRNWNHFTVQLRSKHIIRVADIAVAWKVVSPETVLTTSFGGDTKSRRSGLVLEFSPLPR